MTGRLGAFMPYASAGIAVGAGLIGGAEGAGVFGFGAAAELGARLPLFRSPVFLEPYAGFSAMESFSRGTQEFLPAGFGGIRLGFAFGGRGD